VTGDAQTLTARWVFPACGPPLERGTVTTAGGRILAVEPHGTRAADLDLGNAALIPGLVNAHTHLDLSGARGLIPPTSPDHFTDWLRGVIAYRRTRTPEQTQADTRAGLAECLRFGTTLIGDIAADGQSWDALAAAPVRAVVFREMIGLSQERAAEASLSSWSWWKSHTSTPTTRPALSPHAPYSVRSSLITSINREIPFAIHLAESPGELELLNRKAGPFVEFLSNLGVWDPSGPPPHLARILVASRFNDRALFVHCNYLPPDHCKYIAGLHSIVYCPRTHAAFGHPPHPFRDFLARGVRVCLGTDSLASNPDLDILAEARFVHARYPDFPGDTLLKMVTRFGAEALGWVNETGSVEPGKSADLVAVPLPDRAAADPHELLFAADAPAAPRRTLFRGQWR
jgi:cytosine/adenosine deaminase-related metal-dependent hydrolase